MEFQIMIMIICLTSAHAIIDIKREDQHKWSIKALFEVIDAYVLELFHSIYRNVNGAALVGAPFATSEEIESEHLLKDVHLERYEVSW